MSLGNEKTKSRIALTFVFALMLSNVLSILGPTKAQAVPTITPPSAGTCYQHTSTVQNGALVTIYDIGTIQITLNANELNPGDDAADNDGGGSVTGVAQASDATGAISGAGDVIGNVFTLVPPANTNFVIVPGFQDTGALDKLAAANASISSNAISNQTNDNMIGIQVGVVQDGTVAAGRAIVAVAKDSGDTYPKSGTENNIVTITIRGLGLAVRPSGHASLSGTLAATLDSIPPTGINGGGVVASAISGLSGTINLCTVASPSGQVEVVSDTDDDSADLFDKTAANINLVALGQIGANTTVTALDQMTNAATAAVDLEPIIIRGVVSTSGPSNDQVIRTGRLLLANTDANTGSPDGTVVDSANFFSDAGTGQAPINVTITSDNSSATTTLNAVDIIIGASSGNNTATGFSTTQTSRQGFLGALRAAVTDGVDLNANNIWAAASINGHNGLIQEGVDPTDGTANNTLGGTLNANNTEPFNDNFVDLRIRCDGTDPIAGWFALFNDTNDAPGVVADANTQNVDPTSAGAEVTVGGTTKVYVQGLQELEANQPTSNFNLDGDGGSGNVDGNALLYASCLNSTATILPLNNGFDGQRDVIGITPSISVSNVSNTFTSDVTLSATVSGNHIASETTLELAKLLGVPTTGQDTALVTAQGVAISEDGQLAVDCTDGSQRSVVVAQVTNTTGSKSVAEKVAAACDGGSIASPAAFFTGGAPATISGNSIIEGSPVVQSNARGILITESSESGFNQLLQQIGGGDEGAYFEISLPSGCDVIDDEDNVNGATGNNSGAGNDIGRPSLLDSAGITALFTGATLDTPLTAANALTAASGTTPAKVKFQLDNVGSSTDQAITDSVLVKFDAQDIFCPSGTTGDLTASLEIRNRQTSPTLTASAGSVSLGTATEAFTVGIGDDLATSTKGKSSTNSDIGTTQRLVGGSTCIASPIVVTENDNVSIPIGGRVSARNLDPDNSVLGTILSRGQLWIVPSDGSAFTSAPSASDISFSDDSLVTDGAPVLATTAAINANAPIGSLVVPVKAGSGDAAANATSITIRNLGLTAANSSTAELIASVQFFATDAGVVVNTGGVSAANNASAPTAFSPYKPGAATLAAADQLELNGAASVQINGTLANSLLTSRLTTANAPQINPFAELVDSVGSTDSTAITASAVKPSEDSTDNDITVTGGAGSVPAGSDVTVASAGSFDSVTVKASSDGSFSAVVAGDCSTATSVTVTVTPSLCGTAGTAASTTVLCAGETAQSADDVFNTIAGEDGVASIDEVLAFITAQGGLDAVIAGDTAVLNGVILAIKSALGLS